MIWLMLWAFLTIKAQSITFSNVQKIRTIPGTYTSFSVDNLDNIYLLSATNQLKKLNSKGDSIAVFNDVKKFGEATLIDVTNPLKILLYYKNFSTIVVLDGMLTQKNVIDLRRKNMFRVNAVGLSFNGKIWLYDELDNTLKKLDDKGEVIEKTTDLRQVFSEPVSPKKIFDQNQLVYLYDPQHGIYVFDHYGAFKNKIPVTGWDNLRIAGNYVFGTDSTGFYSYEMPVFKYGQTPVPAAFQGYRQVIYTNNFFYGLREDGLDVISVRQAL